MTDISETGSVILVGQNRYCRAKQTFITRTTIPWSHENDGQRLVLNILD